MSRSPLRIATRASRLALWQANHIAERLKNAAPDREIEVVHISTVGDRDRVEPLRNFGGTGVFTKEVQRAVLDGRGDVAVHSLKDLPTESTEGLVLAAVPERASTHDALILPTGNSQSAGLESLPPKARIGSGSPRRQAQLLHFRDDLQMLEIRGNVETRLRKLDDGEFDGIILAEAGLVRLGMDDRITTLLKPPMMFPAGGQGALGLECRADDESTLASLAQLNHPATHAAVTAERSLLAELRAGCHAPLGTATTESGDSLTLEAVVLSPDGRQRLVAQATRTANEALALGVEVADKLRADGAEQLL